MKHKKKLIIFMPSIEGGGVEKNLFIIANYLAKNLKNTILITYDHKYNKKFNNISIINPTNYFSFKIKSRRGKYLLCLYELFKLLLKSKNYLVFSFQANLYCTIICKVFFNIKIITRSNSSPSGWSKNFFKRNIYNFLLNLVDQIIVNSKEFAKEMKEKFKVDCKTIYNPLNKNEIIKLSKKKIIFPFFKNNKFKIINIGRLVDQKDHMTFLKAISLIKKINNFRFLIIGNGINRNRLLNYIKYHSLSKYVKIISFQNNPYNLLGKSDVLVHTAIYEGLPNVLLEAQVLKKYIISTDCPTGPKEILLNGKAGELVKIGDYKSISEKIIKAQKHSELLKKKIKYGNENIKRFDYDKNLFKYLNIVKKFLDEKNI